MYSSNRWWFVALAVLVAAGIGFGAYNFGFSQGVMESPQVASAIRNGGYAYPQGWYRPWPFGFGFFFPFFFFLFWFVVVRALFWHGPWRGGRRWMRSDQVPPMFDEWHRRAHEQGKGGAPSS
jgi:hypothetical protein